MSRNLSTSAEAWPEYAPVDRKGHCNTKHCEILGMQPNSLDKLLLTRQLRSGGWSYFGSQQSSVETTSLAVMALSTEWPEATQPGLEHLTLLQRRDGGWPAFLGDSESSWTTALVSCALNGTGEFQSIREKA